jgi:ribosomal-protein-alanine N-acetyltransferase
MRSVKTQPMTIAPEPRALGTADADDVARVAGSALAEAWSATSYAATLADPHTLAYGVTHGALVAIVLARLVVDELEVLTVATEPAHRRRGLAAALVDALLAEARARGAARAFLEVRASNAAALALYAQRGFVPIERRARYYRDGEDAVILRAVL